MQIFYVNIGGGEPTVRPDFWELLDYAVDHHVGVKFSTNGFRITPERAAKLAATDYVDVQISLDGATAEVNDHVRGAGTYDAAMRAMANLQAAGMSGFKLSVVCTRHNIGQLDEFKAIADRYGAQLRLTRLRPSGRGADVWEELHPRPGAAAPALRLAGGERRPGADRRLVLPPLRLRRGAARPEPLRRRAGGLPGRPGRATSTPARSRSTTGSGPATIAVRRRLRHRVEALGAVPRAAQPADRRRLHQVLGVRLVPGRLHGREVLHRPAARRPGPRVRQGQQPTSLSLVESRPSASQDHSHTGTVRNAPVPLTLLTTPARQGLRREPARGSARGQLRHAPRRAGAAGPRPLGLGQRRWPDVPTRRGRCCSCRSARSSSTARTCRWPRTR